MKKWTEYVVERIFLNFLPFSIETERIFEICIFLFVNLFVSSNVSQSKSMVGDSLPRTVIDDTSDGDFIVQ